MLNIWIGLVIGVFISLIVLFFMVTSFQQRIFDGQMEHSAPAGAALGP